MKDILLNGQAAVIYGMFVVSLASAVFGEVVSALGNGQHAKMMKLASNFICIASVTGTIAFAVAKVLKLFGLA